MAISFTNIALTNIENSLGEINYDEKKTHH